MPNVLVVGDTVHSTELRHSVPVAIGDPFHYVELDGRRIAVVWSVEGDRISAVDPTIEIERFGGQPRDLAHSSIIACVRRRTIEEMPSCLVVCWGCLPDSLPPSFS